VGRQWQLGASVTYIILYSYERSACRCHCHCHCCCCMHKSMVTREQSTSSTVSNSESVSKI
jgi:hypothetical protein